MTVTDHDEDEPGRSLVPAQAEETIAVRTARQRFEQLKQRRVTYVMHEALDLVWFNSTNGWRHLGFQHWYEFLRHLYPSSEGSRGSQLLKFGQAVKKAADELDVDPYKIDGRLIREGTVRAWSAEGASAQVVNEHIKRAIRSHVPLEPPQSALHRSTTRLSRTK